jgi:hypothetical protein
MPKAWEVKFRWFALRISRYRLFVSQFDGRCWLRLGKQAHILLGIGIQFNVAILYADMIAGWFSNVAIQYRP